MINIPAMLLFNPVMVGHAINFNMEALRTFAITTTTDPNVLMLTYIHLQNNYAKVTFDHIPFIMINSGSVVSLKIHMCLTWKRAALK